MAKKKKAKVKPKKIKKSGKVQSKRSRVERTQHSVALLYYIIMLIFAISLFFTLAFVWTKILPLLNSLDKITNSTTSNLAIYSNLIINLIKA
ncbi:hypothetical protein LCGC14_0931880 [marine sediment metagenome]|uniref:Uncharacterized protein n=1 Tax=marine sediment metagenome TaxID=412755 RepID=A0A0F9NMV3_9ZZZZ|nr:MAG: hypothetical protein Lokiarch_21370 [Candidatus Lokiarchaeum sp. GC14_75]